MWSDLTAGKSKGSATATTSVRGGTFATTSIIDTSNQCFGVSTSRDGQNVYFTTDTAGGYSRIFNLFGWGYNGTGSTPRAFSVNSNNMWSTVPNNGNKAGVMSAPLWVGGGAGGTTAVVAPIPAAPMYKGIANAPSGLGNTFLNAFFKEGLAGYKITIAPAASGVPGDFDVRCLPGFFGAPLLGVNGGNAASVAGSLGSMCSLCTAPVGLPTQIVVRMVGKSDPSAYTLLCQSGYVPTDAALVGRRVCNPDSATFVLGTPPTCVPTPAGLIWRLPMRPPCMSCSTIKPPAACTASVTRRQPAICSAVAMPG
jgi:hypothetical protein